MGFERLADEVGLDRVQPFGKARRDILSRCLRPRPFRPEPECDALGEMDELAHIAGPVVLYEMALDAAIQHRHLATVFACRPRQKLCEEQRDVAAPLA